MPLLLLSPHVSTVIMSPLHLNSLCYCHVTCLSAFRICFVGSVAAPIRLCLKISIASHFHGLSLDYPCILIPYQPVAGHQSLLKIYLFSFSLVLYLVTTFYLKMVLNEYIMIKKRSEVDGCPCGS